MLKTFLLASCLFSGVQHKTIKWVIPHSGTLAVERTLVATFRVKSMFTAEQCLENCAGFYHRSTILYF
jgi:hypothetical protein